MTTVWKYELRAGDEQLIEMPRGAVLLCVDVQSVSMRLSDGGRSPGTEQPCLWAVVHPERETCVRRVLIVGTGQLTELEGAEYVGTFQLGGGRLVFHVFDAGEVT